MGGVTGPPETDVVNFRLARRCVPSDIRERELFAALLEQAFQDSRAPDPVLRAAAQAWWLDRERGDLTSAVGACLALDLDLEAIVTRLQQLWRAERLWLSTGQRARLLAPRPRGGASHRRRAAASTTH